MYLLTKRTLGLYIKGIQEKLSLDLALTRKFDSFLSTSQVAGVATFKGFCLFDDFYVNKHTMRKSFMLV